MFERSFTLSFENKVSKKVTFIFPLIFLIKFQSHETFRKFMKVFLCETFSIGRSNQKIRKKKFKQTHFFERASWGSFTFLTKEFWWCRKNLITCCISSAGVEIFLYTKTSRHWLSGETDSIYGRKHWVPHQLFRTNQASLRVAKLQISFYFLKLFEKLLSIKPFEILINNLLTLKSHNWSALSHFLTASKNLHQDS